MIKDGKLQWHYVLALAVGIVVLWGLSWLLIDVLIPVSYSGQSRGEFGDKFGAINALFSGLAFLGLMITILMQQHDLETQRREMRQTQMAFEQQRFETTFFNLLSAQQDFCNSFSFAEGRHANAPLNWSSFMQELYSNMLGTEDKKGMEGFWQNYYLVTKNRAYLKKFFSLLRYLLELVHRSGGKNSEHYFEIIKLQLSQHELYILKAYAAYEDLKLFKLCFTHNVYNYFDENLINYVPEEFRQLPISHGAKKIVE